MVDYDSYFLAEDLFSLSLTYWAGNTDTLINMATLAYVTNNVEMGLASIKHLNRLGHSSAEASMLSYFIYGMSGDEANKALVKVEMSILYENTPQFKLVQGINLTS